MPKDAEAAEERKAVDLDELEECIPSGKSVEDEIEAGKPPQHQSFSGNTGRRKPENICPAVFLGRAG